MKRVYLGNKELTTIATVTNGGGGGDDTQKWVDYFNGTLTEFTVPDGVTKIKENAFYDCYSLTTITIPNSVTSIGNSAFFKCSSLTGVTLPYSLISIGGLAFEHCSGLTSVTIPANVTSINSFAFAKCPNLTSITVKATTPPKLGNSAIPTNISVIYVPKSSVDAYKSASGWSAYADKIQAIPTPAMKVTYVDNTEKTFYNSMHIDQNTDSNKHNAKNVEIYDGVTSISDNAFDGCTSLTSITIPSTITYIGRSIFNGCTSLSNIIYQGTMANWNNIKFHGSWHDGVPSTTVVTCSDGTVALS